VLLDPGITGYTASALEPGIYYWRVRAKNINSENGAWSVVRKITITT